MRRECIKCGEEFVLYNGKPGLINECVDCASDIPVYLAQEGSDDTGVVEYFGTVNVYETKKAAQKLIRSKGENDG
jgi:predicted  nucleic acid-binding Zn-ribbon protein